MNKLDKQTRSINMVINYLTSDKNHIDKINSMCENLLSAEFGAQYAYITHWFDTNDNGKLKHIHTHFVIELPKRVRLATLLNAVADYCDINTQLITIDSTRSLNASVQYLVHKNDSNKYQYSVTDIKTNYSANDFDYLMNSNSSILDFNNLYNILLESNGELLYVIKTIGVSRYNNYRKVIIDIYVSVYGHGPYTLK